MNLYVAQSTAFSNDANSVLKGVPCEQSVFVGGVVIALDGVMRLASASSYATSNFFGVVVKKVSDTICWVRVSGVSEPVFSGLVESEEYYLSLTPGQIATTPPVGSGTVIAKVGQPFSSTRLLLSKGMRIVRT